MKPHREKHYYERTGWLRAAVLGANDGIVSTASLIIGVAAAQAATSDVLLAGVAGLVAGSMSMAAGEYVSVSSQADTEKADLRRERQELERNPEFEHRELTEIYEQRGLTPELANEVATQLMNHDALAAHARDELGITAESRARPLQAALTSACAFATGAALPLITVLVFPARIMIPAVSIGTLASLALLGGLAARAGGSQRLISIARVTFWGALAMSATAAVGSLFGILV